METIFKTYVQILNILRGKCQGKCGEKPENVNDEGGRLLRIANDTPGHLNAFLKSG
jgi:hypothetical protein